MVDLFQPDEAETNHRQHDGQGPHPPLSESGREPGNNDQGKQYTAHQSAETKVTKGTHDEQVSQDKNEQGRQTTFWGHGLPGEEFCHFHKAG